MQLGQTSVIFFLSRLLASFVGFFATLYIARTLGPDPLGIYNLAVGLVSWMAIAGKVGFSGAISKRVSEGDDQGTYAIAGASIILSLFLLLTIIVVIFEPYVNDYVGYPATLFIVAILFAVLANSITMSLLTGLHLVHVRGILSLVRISGRSIGQIILVAAGLSTAGLFIGHLAGFIAVIVIGGWIVVNNIGGLGRPTRKHYQSLVDFAKFSWLGNLQSRMFNYTDIIVLGFFVASGLIGVYAVAWNISQFLFLFSGALTSTLFPELSEVSSREDFQAVSNILEHSLTYGGLFLIPGLFGGVLLGERILRIYGPEFTQGTLILGILILANLFMGYQKQLLTTLNGIDRPDLAFRVNGVFVGSNLLLNVVLIYLYGWIGAAVATAGSVAFSLVLAYSHVNKILVFELPIYEIGKQWFSAIIMAIIVYGGLWLENTNRLLGHNVAIVLILVTIGACVYFVVLLGISGEFRDTVDRNLPFDLPLVSR